jgi:F-type H+-transporting ATPase subunit epsilon
MPLRVKIIIPDGVLVDKDCPTVIAPGAEGDFQVLPGHLPMFTTLRLGNLWLDEKGEQRVAVFGGTAEVLDDVVTVLADNAEPAEVIDLKRAQDARERAERRIERARTDERVDFARAQASLARAMLRIFVKEGPRV